MRQNHQVDLNLEDLNLVEYLVSYELVARLLELSSHGGENDNWLRGIRLSDLPVRFSNIKEDQNKGKDNIWAI